MSAVGRYITTLLSYEQQLYKENLVAACALLKFRETDHGMVTYCMEKKIAEGAAAICSAAPPGRADEWLRSMAADGWSAHVAHTANAIASKQAAKSERQRIAEFFIDVGTICAIRQKLIRQCRVGVVGPIKSGKSKFLQQLGLASGADSTIHTTEVTSYVFTDGFKDHDTLALLDFPVRTIQQFLCFYFADWLRAGWP